MSRKSTHLLVALISCVLVAVGAGLDLKAHHDDALSRTSSQLESRTRLIAEWVKGAYLASDLRLQDIVEEVTADELRYPTRSRDQHRQRTQWLRHKLANLPGAYFIGVADRNCVVTHHTNPEVRLGLDVSQRDYCRLLKGNDGADSMITPQYRTSFGTLTVTQARRVPGPDGQAAGLVVIGMDMSLFARFLQDMQFAPGEALALVDTRFNLIARNPPANTPMAVVPHSAMLSAFATSSDTQAIRRATSPADGKPRLAVYRKIEGTPMMIVASETDDHWLESWYQRVWEVGAACLVLFVLVGLLLRSQRATATALDRMRLAVDVTQLGFWGHDLRSDRATWSDHVYHHFGLPLGQPVTGRTLKKLIHPDDVARVFSSVSSSIATHDNIALEYRVVRPDGSMRWLRSVGKPHYGDDGAPMRLDGTTQDITEQRALQRAREDAKEADFMLKQQVATQTVAQMAHELNQPLQAISLSNEVAVDLAERTAGASLQLKDAVHHSHEQAQRAGKVLTQLMDQIRAWREGAHRSRPFDLNEVIRKVMDEMRAVHPELQIELKLDRSMPNALGLPLQTEKVLVNLVGNAIESMEGAVPKLTVTSRRRPESNHLWVSVRDYGPGMDARTAASVFDPFFTTKPRGMGLGLGICRSLIHAQEGEIWVERDSHPGATFHFALPMAGD